MTVGQAREPRSTDVCTAADISNGGFSKPLAKAVISVFHPPLSLPLHRPQCDSYVNELILTQKHINVLPHVVHGQRFLPELIIENHFKKKAFDTVNYYLVLCSIQVCFWNSLITPALILPWRGYPHLCFQPMVLISHICCIPPSGSLFATPCYEICCLCGILLEHS